MQTSFKIHMEACLEISMEISVKLSMQTPIKTSVDASVDSHVKASRKSLWSPPVETADQIHVEAFPGTSMEIFVKLSTQTSTVKTSVDTHVKSSKNYL